VLAPQPESVGDARDFTRATLRGWGPAAVSEDAELVVSELATNALRHGLSGSVAPGADGSGPVIGLGLMIQAAR
jgi:anti-sigma regulatory factor (Ser/Thr protein kinase)